MKNFNFRKLALIALFVVMSLSMVACGNTNYSLTQTNQGNVSTVYQKAQCMSNAGSDLGKAANCVTH